MKKIFAKRDKELTPEQQREFLESSGIPVNTGNKRPSKFGQFGDYAQRLAESKKNPLGPNGFQKKNDDNATAANNYSRPSSSQPSGASKNPYANASIDYNKSVGSGNGSGGRPYGGNYGNFNNGSNNPYESLSASDLSGRTAVSPSPYAAAESSYSSRFGYASSNGLELSRSETTDTTAEARAKLFQNANPAATGGLPGRSTMRNGENNNIQQRHAPLNPEDELFEMPSELDASGFGQEQKQELDSEDEDVEAIKGQIRFTKQESVNSTRNTLRLAAEAEESGRNTLGMLGSQGERIANTERSLSLAETQTQIAEEKARELKVLNRPLFVPNVSNPFNSKRRLQEQEARIKSNHMLEQRNREARRQQAYDSQQRVIKGLTSGDSMSETAMKYRNERLAGSAERAKYQFEEDSEDEDLENEIDSNLEGISSAAGRLNRLALSTNEEIIRQNERLDRIADQTDTLDVNVHLNTTRLANIK